MSTQIKRLLQNNEQFVPITLAEAVVVNTSTIPGLQSAGITTLDKVLKTTLGIVGTNATDILTLQETVKTINTNLDNKQNKLTAGTGITISENGTISTTLAGFLYKIVTSLPTAGAECENIIYLKPSTTASGGNLFSEHICVNKEGTYVWELLGVLQSDISLDDYVKNDTFNAFKATALTAEDVTKSDSTKVTVDWATTEALSKIYD